MYKLLHKDDSGFVLVKEMERVTYTLSFSWRDCSIHLIRKIGEGKDVDITCEDTLNEFFYKQNHDTMIEMISTPKNIDVFKYAYILGKNNYNYERAFKLGRGLKRILNYPALQIVNAAGIVGENFKCLRGTDWIRLSKHTNIYSILNISPAMFKLFRDDNLRMHDQNLKDMKKLEETIAMNNVTMLYDIFKDDSCVSKLPRCIEDFISLYKDYGYTDVRRLGTYITRDVKLNQGIRNPDGAVNLLKDYNKMAKFLEYEVEKYPKSLKKTHDITMMNYDANKDEIKDKKIKTVVEQPFYTKLEWKKKSFAIVIPSGVKDIIREGESLSHCVASYVDDVIDNKCQIAFLRSIEELDKPLITIEVRNNVLKQARGRSQRAPNENERLFLQEWAEKKELHYGI